MPDPLAALAVQGGASIVVDDSKYPQYGGSVITFRNDFIEDNEDALRGFLVALERAVQDINQDKDQFDTLLTELNLVPEPLVGTYVVPDFPLASIPPVPQWNDVLDWAQQKGYVEGALSYGDSVDGSYLP
jgi:NitT/TauT family transport system substrate-binding protein